MNNQVKPTDTERLKMWLYDMFKANVIRHDVDKAECYKHVLIELGTGRFGSDPAPTIKLVETIACPKCNEWNRFNHPVEEHIDNWITCSFCHHGSQKEEWGGNRE